MQVGRRPRRPAVVRPAFGVLAVLAVLLASVGWGAGAAPSGADGSGPPIDAGSPWNLLPFWAINPVGAGDGLVGLGDQTIVRVDPSSTHETVVRKNAGGTLRSDGKVVAWLPYDQPNVIAVVPIAGGTTTTLRLPPTSTFNALALAGGRAWFTTASNRLGTATISAAGFGAPTWTNLPGSATAIGLAASADGSARLATAEGRVVNAEIDGAGALTLRSIGGVHPIGHAVAVAVGSDGATYVGTGRQLERIATDGTTTTWAAPLVITRLASGPGIVAYLGPDPAGEVQVGFTTVADGSSRVLPRPRSGEGTGGLFFQSDLTYLAVTGRGSICTGFVIYTLCTAPLTRVVPTVSAAPTTVTVGRRRSLHVDITVAGPTRGVVPTGTVTVTDDRYFFFSEAGTRHDYVVATASARLADGRATIELPQAADPPVTGAAFARVVYVTYVGDSHDGPNTSYNWYPQYPAASNTLWLAHAYPQVFGRPLDAAGRSFWVHRLDQGMSRATVARQLLASTTARRRSVTIAYQRVLGRSPSSAALAADVGRMSHGTTITTIRAELAGSAEFRSRAGGTDSAVVDRLYLLYLGRPADPGGLHHWGAALGARQLTATQLALALQVSAEGAAHELSVDLVSPAPLAPGTVRAIDRGLYHPLTELEAEVEVLTAPEFSELP